MKKKTQIVVYFFTPNLSHMKEQMHRVLCLDHLVNLLSALGKSAKTELNCRSCSSQVNVCWLESFKWLKMTSIKPIAAIVLWKIKTPGIIISC